MVGKPGKISWSGMLTSVQPRIRLLRSFDQRNHLYLGYAFGVDGVVGNDRRQFTIGIGKAAQAKHKFQVGDLLSGESETVPDLRLEPVEFYKTARLKVLKRSQTTHSGFPPWLGPPEPLEVYRQRGHRRLDPRTYKSKCSNCIWGCRMPVEMIVDQWNPTSIRYRFETFCYGPKSCRDYRAGAERTVPGRRGMVWKEEDWVDQAETAHRDIDE
jgi:hypothetical protein